MELLDAFSQIRSDRELTRRFTDDPEGVLSELGVDPSDVVIRKLPGGNAPYDAFSQSVEQLETQEKWPENICVSVGCIVCASAG